MQGNNHVMEGRMKEYKYQQQRVSEAYATLFRDAQQPGSPANIVLEDLAAEYYTLHEVTPKDPMVMALSVGAYSVVKRIRAKAFAKANATEEI